METMLKDIESMGGLEKSFIYKDGNILATTFSSSLEENLLMAGKVISQLYISMGLNNLPYGEIYFEMNDIQLICYSIGRNFFLAFVADLGINISLTRMTVQSYLSQIKEQAKQPPAKREKQEEEKKEQPAALSRECENAIAKISDLLLDTLGPIAPIILDEAVTKWKKENPSPSIENLMELTKIISNSINDDHAKAKFLDGMRSFLKA